VPDLFQHRPFDASLLVDVTSPSWTRLEPQSLSGDPAVGLAAEVYDPLWMLGRQWQLGELTGEDCGTPLVVELVGTASPLRAFAPGDWTVDAPAPWVPMPADVPLEELTEAEAPVGAPGLRGDAAAGAVLLGAFREAGLGAAASSLLAECPLAAPPASLDAGWLGPASVLAGRTVSGALAAAALEGTPAPGLPAFLADAVPPGDHEAVRAVVRPWLEWYRREVAPVPAAAGSWVGRRLEHRFRVSDGEVVLAAPEHAGQEVGWSTFDHLADAVPPAGADTPEPLRQRVIATPLHFPGMPASRFWEMEDAQVDLGAVGADPHDLARLLVVECALVYGGDWLVVPFDVPAASLVRTSCVTYRTTFGETFLAATASVGGGHAPWRAYDVTSVEGEGLGALVVPPVPPGRLEGPVLEEVAFVRDELANLVWAVEHVVEGASGDPVPVPPGRGRPAAAGGPAADGALTYTLATDVPDSWVPYLPHTAGYARVDLLRGAIRHYGPDDPPEGTPQRPRGALLLGDDLAAVAAAEVPREGVRVTRVPVVARTADGTYRAWVSRRVHVGRGEGRSGLAFDSAT
jgi:hypothetical protein